MFDFHSFCGFLLFFFYYAFDIFLKQFIHLSASLWFRLANFSPFLQQNAASCSLANFLNSMFIFKILFFYCCIYSLTSLAVLLIAAYVFKTTLLVYSAAFCMSGLFQATFLCSTINVISTIGNTLISVKFDYFFFIHKVSCLHNYFIRFHSPYYIKLWQTNHY